MRRRDVIGLVGSAAASWPLAARAQQDGRIARVGLLVPGLAFPLVAQGYPVLLAELRKLGFAEGRNLVIDVREVVDNIPNAYAGANELVAAKVDVILVTGAELLLQAAAAARPRVPIVVLANNFDPSERGYVASLSHPGGNITGLFYRQPELAVKQVELLREAFPDRNRVGAMYDRYSAD
jgi:putative tryptophan/tyrosine transport system substrate-binding protein